MTKYILPNNGAWRELNMIVDVYWAKIPRKMGKRNVKSRRDDGHDRFPMSNIPVADPIHDGLSMDHARKLKAIKSQKYSTRTVALPNVISFRLTVHGRKDDFVIRPSS